MIPPAQLRTLTTSSDYHERPRPFQHTLFAGASTTCPKDYPNLQAVNFGRLLTLYTTSGHVTHLTPTNCSKNVTYKNQAHPEMGLTCQFQNQAHLRRDEFNLRKQTKTTFHHGAWLLGWLPGQGSM